MDSPLIKKLKNLTLRGEDTAEDRAIRHAHYIMDKNGFDSTGYWTGDFPQGQKILKTIAGTRIPYKLHEFRQLNKLKNIHWERMEIQLVYYYSKLPGVRRSMIRITNGTLSRKSKMYFTNRLFDRVGQTIIVHGTIEGKPIVCQFRRSERSSSKSYKIGDTPFKRF